MTTIRSVVNGSAIMVKRRPRKEDYSPAVQKVIENFETAPMEPMEQGTEYKADVTSTHMVVDGQVSPLDSAVLSPEGTIHHGRYGVIPEPAASAVPLEYLALLRPAAEGAAALRTLTKQTSAALTASEAAATNDGGPGRRRGTILVYGASEINGHTACQLANAAGHAVIALVANNHNCNENLMFCMKHMLNEPGTAIPQECAVLKYHFRQLVHGIATGHEGIEDVDIETYVKDFKGLLQQYSEFYPDTRPGTVPAEMLEFKPYMMGKDREQWDANMRTYVQENYPPGAPPLDGAKFDAFFTPQQYEIFRQKFWHQNTLQLSGEDVKEFNPPELVQKLIRTPEEPAKAMEYATGYPHTLAFFHKEPFPPGTDIKAGGPVLGAILCVNPELVKAAHAVAAAPTLRAKGEALQFLTKSERQCYLSAKSVVNEALAAGGSVVVVGGELPGLQTVEPTDQDVQHALSAMDIDDDGKTILNYFVQSYRANDFPFYADYAVHLKSQPMAGPREFIVLK